MITLSGCIAGVIFSRVMLYLLNTYISSEYNYSLNLLGFEGAELWLIALSIATGLIAALWPAIIVYRQHISLTLRNK